MGGQFRRRACRGELAARRAVEVIELALDRVGIGAQLMHGAAGVLGFAAGELHIALFGRCGDRLLALLQGLRVLEAVAVGGAHVVHADSGNRPHAWVDLGCADDEAAATANTQHTNALAIDEGLAAEVVHGGAEIFGIHIGQHGIARRALAVAPEG